MRGSLLQGEDVDHDPVQNVIGFCKKLVEPPAFLLIRLQDVGQNGHQLVLQPPATAAEEEMLAQPQARTAATRGAGERRSPCAAAELPHRRSRCPVLHPLFPAAKQRPGLKAAASADGKLIHLLQTSRAGWGGQPSPAAVPGRETRREPSPARETHAESRQVRGSS